MMFFHIIYLSSQNHGLVTHGSLIEVIFQNKAPFSNEKPMNIGVWDLKKVMFELRSANYFPCSKNPRDSHPPTCQPHLFMADVVEETCQHRGVLRILRGPNLSSDVTFRGMGKKQKRRLQIFEVVSFLLFRNLVMAYGISYLYVSLCQYWALFLNE